MSCKNENFIIDFLKENHNITFNNQQKTALKTINGNILLVAVPGAGKTTVMVSRIANMIYNYGIKAENILTLTFSVSSAKDMKERYESLFLPIGGAVPTFSTIHSFALNVLKYYCSYKGSTLPTLIEGSNNGFSKSRVLRDIYKQVNNEILSEDIFIDLCSDIGYVKNMCISDKDEMTEISSVKHFYDIFMAYENFKLKNNLMDFDDMLSYAYIALLKYPKILNYFSDIYKYINVDEAQDTSKIQHKIIRLLNKNNGNLFMVGDEDQSIYAFRGAYPDALLEFEKTYENAIILKMEENFRSKEQIITCANRFIEENKNRHEKTMFATEKNKSDENCVFSVRLDNQNSEYSYIYKLLCEFDKNKTVGILYRNNYCSVAIADFLHNKNIDFKIKEHKSFFSGTFVIKDIINFLKLSLDMTDYNAFSSVFYKTSFYLKKSFTEIYNLRFFQGENLFDVLIDKLYNDENNLYQKAEQLKKLIESLKFKKPADTIDIILDEIGYLDYLKYISTYKSYSNHIQKISAFKNLVFTCNTIEDALYKVDSIDNLIKEHSNSNSNITLSTAHSAKGLEFDYVIVADLFDGVFPSVSAISDLEENKDSTLMEEEARLFYVCATRAKEQLFIFSADKSCGDFISSSRFINRFLFDKPVGNGCADDIYVGMKVTHFVFGDGEILNFSIKDNYANIFFQTRGTRKISLDIFGTAKFSAKK